MSRTILVSDIHGCTEEFDEILKIVQYSQKDRLILLGDEIDRGPDSLGVLRKVQELKAECVLGNHEEKYLRYRHHENLKKQNPSYKNPMKSFGEEKIKLFNSLSETDFEFLKSLPAFIRINDNWIAVHAGFEPHLYPEQQSPSAVCRIRYLDKDGKNTNRCEQVEGSKPWWEFWTGPESVIFGHYVISLDKPLIYQCSDNVFCYGLDTGCVFGGYLTALILETKEIVQVKAKKEYKKRRFV